jgi:hypothetical protein
VSPKNWKRDHDPEAQPLGCNGKYGGSGRKMHQRAGTPTCHKCRASNSHYQREFRRGQPAPRPRPKPCGTMAAAHRHREAGEKPCLDCYAAEAKYHADLRERQRLARLEALHAEGRRLAEQIIQRRRRRCSHARKHTSGHCDSCGVHRTLRPGRVAATTT